MRFSRQTQRRTNRSNPYAQRVRVLTLFTLGFIILVVIVFALRIRTIVQHSYFLRGLPVGIVFNTKPIVFLHIDRTRNTIIAVTIPPDVHVETPHGLGSYRIGVVWKLGEIEKIGGMLLAETIQEILATPTKLWVNPNEERMQLTNPPAPIGSGPAGGKASDQITQVIGALSPFSFIWGRETNMNLIDRIFFIVMLTKIPLEKMTIVDIGGAIGETQLPDGSKALMLDTVRLDGLLEGMFEYPDLRSEGLSVEVRNASNTPYIAQRAARVLTTIGVKVVKVDNWDTKEDKCLVIGRKQLQESLTTGVIQLLFNCSYIERSSQGREDLQVIVGKEYGQKLYGKE